MKFRKKPVVVEAWPVSDLLYHSDHVWLNLPECVRDHYEAGDIIFASDHILILTLEGKTRADPGDMLIRGVAGGFYPCKPDVFEKTYERVFEPADEPMTLSARLREMGADPAVISACVTAEQLMRGELDGE